MKNIEEIEIRQSSYNYDIANGIDILVTFNILNPKFGKKETDKFRIIFGEE